MIALAALNKDVRLALSVFGYINGIAIHIQEGGKHDVQLLPGLVESIIWLFADDIILTSVSQSGLQKQLDCLQEACEERNLEVNCDKTKIRIFIKGGYIKRKRKVFHIW